MAILTGVNISIVRMKDTVFLNVQSALLLVMCHLLWRMFLCVEEIMYMQNRTKRKILHVMKRATYFNSSSVFFVFSIIIFAVCTYTDWDPSRIVQEVGLLPFALSVIFSFIICQIILLNQCPAWEAHQMNNMNGLDYGSGMAHSYFHGYLQIVLPSKGDNNLGLRERILMFMEKHHIEDCDFPVKRLVVLIPSSGFSFPNFKFDTSLPEDERDIEPSQWLEDTLRDRAGTTQRVYRGGAYRIRIRGNQPRFMYVIAEGATPMQTFCEAYNSQSSNAKRLKEHKQDIVRNFYTTLQELIEEDPQCRNLVDLIYYNDEVQPQPTVLDILKRRLLQ